MKINNRLTNQYYDTYIPCNCGNCRYFIKNIETKQPELCAYLKSLGINPLKPYELMSIFHRKDKTIEYFDCAYVVFGTIDNEIETIINDVKITTCEKERYPLLETNEDYFLITFGPIKMSYAYAFNRHFTFNDKVQIIKQAIDEVDPIRLLAMHCPKDEYMAEAKIIAKEIKNNFVKGKYIQEVFKRQFKEEVAIKKCYDISRRINAYFQMEDYFKNFEENEILKDKVTIDNYEITLKIHDDFIIKHIGNCAYINDKFYDNIEEQDLLEFFCDLVEDNDTIYVQYQHKHFSFFHFRYFKKIKKSKYYYWKLKHKKDIELIFDNKKVIYTKK